MAEWLLDALSSRSIRIPKRKRSRFRATTSNVGRPPNGKPHARRFRTTNSMPVRGAHRAFGRYFGQNSKHGYDHLSSEEKRLFDESQR